MKVAVTGGNGQIGRHVVTELQKAHEVTVLDIVGEKSPLQPFGPVDVMDLDRVSEALAGHDAVAHLGGIDAATVVEEEKYFSVNTLGTWNVVHAGYEAGIRTFALCSSDGVYGETLYVPVDEDHPKSGNDSYDLSKRAVEIIGQGFAERDGVSVSVIRPSHVAFDHVAERMVLFHQGLPEPESDEYVDPLPEDGWYVAPEDVATCFRAAIERAAPGYDVFNAGADDTFCPEPTRELLKKVLGREIPERNPELYDNNPFASPCDNSKAKRVLGWEPKINWKVLQEKTRNQS